MKRLMLLSLLLISCQPCFALDLSIISRIESNNKDSAIGDSGRSRGRYQIYDLTLSDFNKDRLKQRLKPYLSNDLHDKAKSYEVAQFKVKNDLKAIKRRNLPITIENQIIAWNCGVGCLSKKSIPNTTKAYISKYKGYLNK